MPSNQLFSIKMRQVRRGTLLVLFSIATISCAKKQLPQPDANLFLQSNSTPADPYSYVPSRNQVKANSKADADQIALLMYRRLVGVSVPVGSQIIQDMSAAILADNAGRAAALAVNEPNFLNITVRYMGIKMSYQDEKPNHPSNDFTATLVGAVRDDVSAYELLTGNFSYRVDPARLPAGVAVRSDVYTDILRTNNHYIDLDARGFNATWLARKDGMEIVAGNNVIDLLPDKDASPLLTSRGFTAAHAIAGTNRRMYQYTFLQFMCVGMTEFSDTSVSDEFVGRDVDRYDPKFQTRCKGCHGQMDGMRGAFANIDFFDNGTVGFLKHSSKLLAQPLLLNQTENEFNFKTFRGPNGVTLYPGVAEKMNHNEQVYTPGRIIDSDAWTNLAVGNGNSNYFGWRGALKGNGIKSFARMIAGSERFGKCMAAKVFTEVCKRKPNDGDQALINYAGKKFEDSGYKFKGLFQTIVPQAECLGK
ncbi:MAG: hypothetical protein A4S09_07035 [Proteobacteria bacterium SG_bin7]|nr:MAG: hypothetical protein A4S09_07035 [Proteobacteria bacterium SG_bin7]